MVVNQSREAEKNAAIKGIKNTKWINKLIKVALVGKTNAGKSTLINTIVGEKISIINKKINTTQVSTLGIKNINDIIK